MIDKLLDRIVYLSKQNQRLQIENDKLRARQGLPPNLTVSEKIELLQKQNREAAVRNDAFGEHG